MRQSHDKTTMMGRGGGDYTSNVGSHVKSFEFPENYKKYTRPNHGRSADIINVSMGIVSIKHVNEDENEFDVDFLLRTSWADLRLAKLVNKTRSFVSGFDDIWTPDIHIENSVRSIHPEKNSQVATLNREGIVIRNERLYATISCSMSFLRYPFGKQFCSVILKSYGYNDIELKLIWNGFVSIDETNCFDPEYSIYEVEQSSFSETTEDGEFVNLSVGITLKRNGLRMLWRSLAPTLLLAIISYASLYLRIDYSDVENKDIEDSQIPQVPLGLPSTLGLLRVSLNALTFLLIILISQTSFLTSPKSGTITAMDIWTGWMTTVIIIAWTHAVQTYFHEWKQSFTISEESQVERTWLKLSEKILFFGIPSVTIPFIIVFFIVCLS